MHTALPELTKYTQQELDQYYSNGQLRPTQHKLDIRNRRSKGRSVAAYPQFGPQMGESVRQDAAADLRVRQEQALFAATRKKSQEQSEERRIRDTEEGESVVAAFYQRGKFWPPSSMSSQLGGNEYDQIIREWPQEGGSLEHLHPPLLEI